MLKIQFSRIYKLIQSHKQSIAILCLAGLCNCTFAFAQDWQNQPYPYIAVEQNIKMVLQDFEKNTGIKTICSEKVQGTVTLKGNNLTAKAFLHVLASKASLIWFIERDALYVDAKNQTDSVAVDISAYSQEDVFNVLERLPKEVMGNSVIYEAQQDQVVINGGKHFIDLTLNQLNTLKPKAGARGYAKSHGKVRVFKGTLVDVNSF